MAESLFVAHDLLEACKGWQEVINAAPDSHTKDQAGNEATAALQSIDGFHGAKRLILKTDGAMMLPDGMSMEEMVWPALQFSDIRIMGDLGRVTYVRLRDSGAITWLLSNVRTLDTPTEREVDLNEREVTELSDYYLPADRPASRPMYVPVGMIDYVLCAA